MCLLWMIVLAGILIFESFQTSRHNIPERVQRFSKGLNRLLLLIPLLAVPVFAVLFLFVLKDRLCERLSHAILLLSLWLYAARYYWFLISYYKYLDFGIFIKPAKSFCLFILFGVCSAAAAIYLTPLDRYVEKLYSVLGRASVLPGIGLLLVFYIAAFFTACANKTEVSGDSRGIDR